MPLTYSPCLPSFSFQSLHVLMIFFLLDKRVSAIRNLSLVWAIVNYDQITLIPLSVPSLHYIYVTNMSLLHWYFRFKTWVIALCVLLPVLKLL